MAPWSGRRWSSKQYILAALLGTLVAIAAAAAAAISISLSPGHVSFAVKDASLKSYPGSPGLSDIFNNFTVVANNTSKRMAVQYGSLTAEIWYTEKSWVPTDEVNTTEKMPGWWSLGQSAFVKISADWGQYNEKANDTGPSQTNNKGGTNMGKIKWPYCLVYLEAKVWFRFGLVPTMPYTVRASCFPVNFRDGQNDLINCTS